MSEVFQSGNIVKLKSGSPHMAVTGFSDSRGCLECAWQIHAGSKVQRYFFDSKLLISIDRPSGQPQMFRDIKVGYGVSLSQVCSAMVVRAIKNGIATCIFFRGDTVEIEKFAVSALKGFQKPQSINDFNDEDKVMLNGCRSPIMTISGSKKRAGISCHWSNGDNSFEYVFPSSILRLVDDEDVPF